MKIALVHYSFPPVVGGVEAVVAGQARCLASAGHLVHLIGFEGGICEHGIKTQRMERGARVDALEEVLRTTFATVDVVIIHNVGTMPFHLDLTETLWRLALEGSRGTRFIHWIHDIAVANPDYLPPGAPVPAEWVHLASAHPECTYVAVSGERAATWSGMTGAPCRVIPNGIDPAAVLNLTPAVGAFAESRGLFTRDIVLLQPARLLRRKRVEVSIGVTAALHALGRSCALLVTAPRDPHNAASADYATELRGLSGDLFMEDHVYLLADHFSAGPGDMASLYTLADGVIIPSRDEGFGLPMVEAALHRVPAFCLDLSPPRDLPGAIAIPLAASPEAIASLIIQQLAASTANLARKAVAHTLTWQTVYGKYLAPLLAEAESHPTR